MGLFAWLMIIAICLSVDADAGDDQKQTKDHYCYKLDEMTEIGKSPELKKEDKQKCPINQCFRMKYWTETSVDGKKKDKKYPGYFGGCREDLPGEGGPWEFHNECKDYTVSRDFLKALKTEEKKLNTDNFEKWVAEINATKAENCTENENIEFKYDYKVEMCYCKNEKDGNGNDLGTPCNGKKENGYWKTIGVSKSGVATLALTIVLLLISIIGVWFFVKSCQVDKAD